MSNVLGSLFVELRADTAAFVDGMSKASYASKRAGEDIERSFSRLGGVAERALEPFGSLGVAIAASFEKIGETAGLAVTRVAELSSILSRTGSEGGKTGGTLVKLSEGFGAVASLAKIAAAAAGAVGVGAIGLAVHTAESNAKMLAQAKAAGVSVEALSGLSFAAKLVEVDQETVVKSLVFLSANMLKASFAAEGTKTAFSRLGLDIHKHNGELKDAATFYVELIDRLNRLPQSERAGFAKLTLGKGGAANLALGDKEEIEKRVALQKALGANLDTGTAEASEKFTQSIKIVEEAAHGLNEQLTRELLPSLNGLIDYMTQDLSKGPNSFIRGLITDVAELAKDLLSLAVYGVFTFKVLKEAASTFSQPVTDFENEIKRIEGQYANKGLLKGLWASTQEFAAGTKLVGREITGGKGTHGDDPEYFNKLAAEAKKMSDSIWHPPPFVATKDWKPKDDADITHADKGHADEIQKVIDKYEEEVASHLRLANAATISTAAIKEQQASDLADQVLVKLRDEVKGRADLVAKLKEQEGAVRAAVSASVLTGDVFKVGEELQKESDTYKRHVDSLRELAIAYAEGGSAIAAAKIEEQLGADKQKIEDTASHISKLSKDTKDYDTVLAQLYSDLSKYNGILDKHREQLTEQQKLTAANPIINQAKIWNDEIPLLATLNAAYFQNAEAVRDAELALEQYRAQQKLISEGVTDPAILDKAAQNIANEAAQKRTAQIGQESQRFNPEVQYNHELDTLTRIKAALEKNGADTLAIDTAIYERKTKYVLDYRKAVYDSQNEELAGLVAKYDQSRAEITQWDDRIAKVGTFSERIHAMVNEVELQGSNFGEKIFGSFTKAIDSVSGELAKLVVTGKSNFRQLFASLEEEVLKATFQKGFATLLGGIFGGPQAQGAGPGGTPPFAEGAKPAGATGILGTIGSIFGIGKGIGSKADGSSANPFYVISSGGGLGAKKSSVFDILPGSIPSSGSDGGGSALSGIGGVFGKLLSGIGGLFGGFLAGGGDVSPGKAYIVGEKHPEFFVPKQPGHVATSIQTGGDSNHTEYHFHISGVQDADSFRRSQGQIFGDALRGMQLAHSRTR
jgi:hypothetical protein